MDAILQALKAAANELPYIECSYEEHMKNHTSLRIGGPVRAMFFPGSDAALTEILKLLNRYGVPPLILGNGSNILADDKPLDIVAIKTTGLRGIERTGETEITAGSGVTLSKLAVFAYECGLAGLEFSHGIPGTLGGAVIMNAGAYSGEIKDVIHRTKAFSAETGEYTITGARHDFSYRHSVFSDSESVLLSSVIRLKADEPEMIKARMEDLTERRRARQPLELPSAGSIFKRPGEGYAAELIERAGLKGYTVGGAQVSEKHSGFIVNLGKATFADMTAVIGYVRETVLKQSGIELELEVRIVSTTVNANEVR